MFSNHLKLRTILALVLALLLGMQGACVAEAKATTGVTLEVKKVTIIIGDTYSVPYTIAGENPDPVTLKSAKPAVVQVVNDRDVLALKAGKSKITVKSGAKKAVLTVTVVPPAPESVTIDTDSITIKKGETRKLVATVLPAAANQKVGWKSSNKKIATVNAKGVVKGVGAGECVITCTTKTGQLTASANVTVESAPAPTPTPDPTPSVPKGLVYEIVAGEVKVTGYTGSATNINLPGTIEGYPLTEIAAGTFSYCPTIVTLTIPKSVERIGKEAFAGCTNLKNLTVPFIGETRESWSRDAILSWFFLQVVDKSEPNVIKQTYRRFDGIRNVNDTMYTLIPMSLRSVTITNQGSLHTGALSACKMLKSVVIKEGLTNLSHKSISHCEGLTLLELPNSLKSTDSSSMTYNLSLRSLKLPEGLEEIGDYSFEETALESIVIPKTVTKFGQLIFRDCDSLKKVTLQDGLTRFDSRFCFDGCSVIERVEIPASVTFINEKAFSDCDSPKLTIYAPAGTEAERHAKANGIPFVAI